jgi:hypothetical protein
MTPRPNQLRPTKGWRKPPAAVIVPARPAGPTPTTWPSTARPAPSPAASSPARHWPAGALPRRRAPGGRQPQAPTRKALTPCDGVERPLPHHRPALPQPAHGRRAPLQDARRIRIQPSSPAGRRPARAGGADARLCRRHDGRAAGLPRRPRRARAHARRLQVLPRQRMSRDPWVTRRGERRRSSTTPAGRPDPAPRR